MFIDIYISPQVDNRCPLCRTGDTEIFNLKNILRQLDDVVDWKSLGMELDISSARLNEIEVNNRGRVAACRRDMVEAWLATDGAVSWSKLADALVAVGQDVRAELVRGQAGELYLGGCGSIDIPSC